jgi:hypothetical protein
MTRFCQVADLLESVGPMSTEELSRMLGVGVRHAASTVHKMHTAQHLHITRWDRKVVPGSSSRPVAVYAAGWGPEPKRPAPAGSHVAQRRYRERVAALRRVPTSVFDLGRLL